MTTATQVPTDRLRAAARPVLDQLVHDLGPVRIWMAVRDQGDQVIEQRDPAGPAGVDPVDDSTATVRATASIPDPMSGRDAGSVHLACGDGEPTPLLRALASRTAREIAQRLGGCVAAEAPAAGRRFPPGRRGANGALVFLADDGMTTNAAATGLVDAVDEAALRAAAARRLLEGSTERTTVELRRGGECTIRCEPVLEGGRRVGVLVRLRPVADRGVRRPTFGWDSLTRAEVAVMELVVDGLTNREAGDRLFMSHHTVDSHLRSIFRKLGLSSRVDLARVVIARGAATDGRPAELAPSA